MYAEQFRSEQNVGIEPADFCPCQNNGCTHACVAMGASNCYNGCKNGCLWSCDNNGLSGFHFT